MPCEVVVIGGVRRLDRDARGVTFRHPVLGRDLQIRYDRLVLAAARFAFVREEREERERAASG